MNLIEALANADAIVVSDSDLLTKFPTKLTNGELVFCWERNGLGYEVRIHEESCLESVSTEEGFIVLDENEDEVVIKPYKLVLLGSSISLAVK
jgi:hypothetical protein